MVSGSNPLAATSSFIDTVQAVIAQQRMIRRGDRVLVAVSGGPDSLALLSALVALREEYRLHLRAAYVNHGLRPAAARKEATLVEKVGRLWAVPVSVVEVKVGRRRTESPESAARRARYAALTALARRTRCAAVAVGHTADDQAETVLMRILRGAGTSGLAGIPPIRRAEGEKGIWIIRPLIRTYRREVEDYLRHQGIRPLLDRSNRSLKFLRNRIRGELIPLLEREFNPQLRRRLAGLAEIFRADSELLRRNLLEEFRKVARVRGSKVRLNRSLLRKEPAALRRGILRLAAERLQGNGTGFSQSNWEALDRLLVQKGPGALDLPHGFRAVVVPKKETEMRICRADVKDTQFHK